MRLQDKAGCSRLAAGSLGGDNPPMLASKAELLCAVDLAIAGEWDAAHGIVQQFEDDAAAAWIHAVLHKIEGDLGNARYWYQRAGQMGHVADEPQTELGTIRARLAD